MLVKKPTEKIPVKLTKGLPNPPRRPIKNDIPFENPRRKCSVPLCPNFCTAYCGLCDLHCRKIHKGRHESVGKLIKEYGDKKYDR